MHKEKGVTLVELAIVIVIIGILIGGIFAGRDLIHQAQIHKVLSQINDYNVGLNSFYLKFKGWPGDLKRADKFGIDANTSYAGAADGSNNGNGNGYLESLDQEGNMQDWYFNGEVVNFWEHLSNAGLIKGSYKSTNCISGGQCTAGTAYPSAPLGNGIAAVSTGVEHFDWVLGLNNAGYGFTAGGGDMGPTGGLFNYQDFGAFTLLPYDAWAIDVKLDDGVPNTGAAQFFTTYSVFYPSTANSFVIDTNQYTPSTTTCTLPSGQYNVTLETPACSIYVKASGG